MPVEQRPTVQQNLPLKDRVVKRVKRAFAWEEWTKLLKETTQKPRILIIGCQEENTVVGDWPGSYLQWGAQSLGRNPKDPNLTYLNAADLELSYDKWLQLMNNHDGVLSLGSGHSVTEELPWMKDLARNRRSCVCFLL